MTFLLLLKSSSSLYIVPPKKFPYYAIVAFLFPSVLHLCHDLVLLSQPGHAHEVHDTS